MDIEGDNSFKKFDVEASVENENFKSLTAEGNFQIVENDTKLDLNLNFQRFNLGILAKL